MSAKFGRIGRVPVDTLRAEHRCTPEGCVERLLNLSAVRLVIYYDGEFFRADESGVWQRLGSLFWAEPLFDLLHCEAAIARTEASTATDTRRAYQFAERCVLLEALACDLAPHASAISRLLRKALACDSMPGLYLFTSMN